MGRPRLADRTEPTRERILAAGASAFAELGPNATLGEIAAQVGIRRPSLLYHFQTKEELYGAVVRQTFARLGEALEGAMRGAGEPPDQAFPARMEALTRAYTRFLEEHTDHARIVARAMLEADGPGPTIVREQVGPLLEVVVTFVARAGAGHLRPGLPVKAAVLQIVADVLLQSAAVGVRDLMWGPSDADRTWTLARTLLLKEQG